MGEYLEQQPSRGEIDALAGPAVVAFGTNWCGYCLGAKRHIKPALADHLSSEERRVGKECRTVCRSRWSPYH